jgi:hypothetical protein
MLGTVNLDVLQSCFMPQPQENIVNWIYQEDVALAHFHNEVMSYLQALLPNKVIGLEGLGIVPRDQISHSLTSYSISFLRTVSRCLQLLSTPENPKTRSARTFIKIDHHVLQKEQQGSSKSLTLKIIFVCFLTLVVPWRWRQYISPRSWSQSAVPHGVDTQNIIIIIVTAVRTTTVTGWTLIEALAALTSGCE